MKFYFKIVFLFLINFIYAQEQEYEVFNTSINSPYAELGVKFITENSVIFASSKKSDSDKPFSKNRRKNNRQLHLELYKSFINNYGDLVQTSKFTQDINNPIFESDISFAPDNKTIYFTFNNFYNIQSRKDSVKWKTQKIVKATINNSEISNISPLPFNNKSYSVKNPCVSKDGKKLYFVSDMPGGFGENDIYVVDILENGSFGTPKNLGPNVNSSKHELFPFVDKNNTLYFSSYGFKGLGNLDIYKSEFKNETYQKATNLPYPINSKFDDFAFVINSSNELGYITSNRAGGKGDVDIYAFKIKDIEVVVEEKEEVKIVQPTISTPKECIQELMGTVLNSITKEPINEATINIFEGNNFIKSLKLNNKSSFTYKLKCNTNYRFVAASKNYNDDIELINTSTITGETIEKSFLLQPNIEFVVLRGKKMIKTNAINFDLDKSNIREDAALELKKVVDILNKYPKLKIEIKTHTDSRAPFNYNMDISNKRAKSIIDHIILKGIAPERVSGKGYGETELLNKCSNGIKCSEAEHQQNRRTEFIVIEE